MQSKMNILCSLLLLTILPTFAEGKAHVPAHVNIDRLLENDTDNLALAFVNFNVGSCQYVSSKVLFDGTSGCCSYNLEGCFSDDMFDGSSYFCSGDARCTYFSQGASYDRRHFALNKFDMIVPRCEGPCSAEWKIRRDFTQVEATMEYDRGTLEDVKLLCNDGSILAILGKHDGWEWGSGTQYTPHSSPTKYMLLYSSMTENDDINAQSMYPNLSNKLEGESDPEYCLDFMALLTKLQKDLPDDNSKVRKMTCRPQGTTASRGCSPVQTCSRPRACGQRFCMRPHKRCGVRCHKKLRRCKRSGCPCMSSSCRRFCRVSSKICSRFGLTQSQCNTQKARCGC